MDFVLKYFKDLPEAYPPEYATPGSSCFDIRACLPRHTDLTFYSAINQPGHIIVPEEQIVTIRPKWRVMIPTGLIFHIPPGHSIRVHPRSGLSLKWGMTLINSTGIIDSDYINPVYILIHNTSDELVHIEHGDRICQGEVVKDMKITLEDSDQRPVPTTRSGGFGSTGTK